MFSSNNKTLKARLPDEPTADVDLYRSAACSIMDNIQATRVDAAYAVNICARYLSNPGQTHLEAVIRAMSTVPKQHCQQTDHVSTTHGPANATSTLRTH